MTLRSLILAIVSLAAADVAAAVPAEAGRLLLYTSQPQTDAQRTVDAFMKAHPGTEATFVRDGTPRILAKLRAEIEAGTPQADVLLLADSVTMESLKREGRLLAYPEANVSGYPAALVDPDHSWFATKVIATGIVYNARAPFVPASWADLARPEAKDLVAMPSPLASGAAMIHAQSLADTLPSGWNYYESLRENGATAAGGNGDILKQVATGEKLFGMIVDFMPIREKAKGAPVTFVVPAEGVSAVTEPVAILKTTKNVADAKALVDFLVSPDGQALAVAQGYQPALPGVAPPPGFPSGMKIIALDARKALADTDADRKRFTDIFGQ